MPCSGGVPAVVGFVVHFDFHSVSELHSFDDLGQIVESPDPSPAFLCAHPQLVEHRQHGVPAHAALGLICPVTNRGKG